MGLSILGEAKHLQLFSVCMSGPYEDARDVMNGMIVEEEGNGCRKQVYSRKNATDSHGNE